MNPNTPDFHDVVLEHAREDLFPARKDAADIETARAAYQSFFSCEKNRIKKAHKDGSSGLEIAAWRSAMVDLVIKDCYKFTEELEGGLPFTLLASGGYGRGLLNPGSDIDLQFLLHDSLSSKDIKWAEDKIRDLLTLLFDSGFDVGHGARTIKEAISFANEDHPTKTALLDARLIAGNREVFNTFEDVFFKDCIKGKEKRYLKERSEVIRARHRKYGRTVHCQEPHVKLGCGGLRDYHNLIWLIWVQQKSRDLKDLVESGQLSQGAYDEIEAAYEFLMRVRNDLHFSQKNNSGDILTIRLQGIIANHFRYKGKTIIQRSEEFMREYYGHTRALYQHGTSLMQAFHLEVEESILSPVPIVGALAARFHRKKVDSFEGFVVRDGLIFPDESDPFEENPRQLMRFFLHTQQRALKTSPEIRKLFKEHWEDIDDDFRASRSNREVFEQILQNRGQVSQILRQMHRVGFLGRYIPEFGQLTDLVQHEFFHRFTADEHTLRCIDELDRVLLSEEPKEQVFRELFQDLADPVALYVALIMHDTGRAEGVRKHEDASATLAADVCRRLRYTGDRLKLILFLVDSHLAFFRTATTMDISDRDTIEDFAATVKNKSWMETLYLFTYVDSRGTSEDAWNDWKASLMKQLYVSTGAYFEDREAFDQKFDRDVSETKRKVLEKLSDSYEEEVGAHFETLPDRYFNYRGSTSVARHVRLFRKFFKQIKFETSVSLLPVFGWEARDDEGYTLLEVACWNRHGLLATIAGALASRNLNILSADVFTREDDLVLDIFRVCTTNFNPIKSKAEIGRLEKLITDACRADKDAPDVDFQKLIKKQAEPSVLDVNSKPQFIVPQRVIVNNEQNVTVVELQVVDRIGLLYDVFKVLGRLETDVLNARISTQAGAAIDRFAVVDNDSGKKIVDQDRLDKIQQEVWECVAIAEQALEKA